MSGLDNMKARVNYLGYDTADGRNVRKLNFATRNSSISSTSSTTRQKKGAVVGDRSLLII